MLFIVAGEAMTSCGRMLAVVGLALGLSLSVSEKTFAAAQDYRFELAAPIAQTGKTVLVKIRLIHVRDGKAVPAAILTQTKFDMGPEGMATMTAPIKTVPAADPAIYQFEVQPSMPGSWAIGLAAKVQGEAETVRGSVTVSVPK